MGRGDREATLEGAMLVLAEVRVQLGIPSSDLSLGSDGATATFVIEPSRAVAVRFRRWDMLSSYVERGVQARLGRIHARRLRLDDARARSALLRSRARHVQDHIDAVRAFLAASPV